MDVAVRASIRHSYGDRMDFSNEPNAQASGDNQPGEKATAPSRAGAITSHELFRGGAREVIIIHQQEQYRLRITRQGKLILTK
jgi:hemin uptake protein HemP